MTDTDSWNAVDSLVAYGGTSAWSSELTCAINALVAVRRYLDGASGLSFPTLSAATDPNVVTAADLQAERVIVELISEQFPDDSVRSEEGRNIDRDPERVWHIDPLDGSHNYAMGIGSYGATILLKVANRPAACAFYSAVQDAITLAANDLPTRIQAATDPVSGAERATTAPAVLAFVQPYGSTADSDFSRLKATLDRVSQRLLVTWAPTVDATLLLLGRIDGLVLTSSESEDVAAVGFALRQSDLEAIPLASVPVHPTPMFFVPQSSRGSAIVTAIESAISVR